MFGQSIQNCHSSQLWQFSLPSPEIAGDIKLSAIGHLCTPEAFVWTSGESKKKIYLLLGSTGLLNIGYQDIKIYLEILRNIQISQYKKKLYFLLEVQVFSSFEISQDIEKWIEDNRYEYWI